MRIAAQTLKTCLDTAPRTHATYGVHLSQPISPIVIFDYVYTVYEYLIDPAIKKGFAYRNELHSSVLRRVQILLVARKYTCDALLIAGDINFHSDILDSGKLAVKQRRNPVKQGFIHGPRLDEAIRRRRTSFSRHGISAVT